jgi:hypothetical protein
LRPLTYAGGLFFSSQSRSPTAVNNNTKNLACCRAILNAAMKKPDEEMSEDEVDKILEESFPASDPPSWTLGTDHKIISRQPEPTLLDRVFHQLAKAFNGLHWIIGITTLPENAPPREERSFVLMWLGIIVFMIVFFVVMLYLLT